MGMGAGFQGRGNAWLMAEEARKRGEAERTMLTDAQRKQRIAEAAFGVKQHLDNNSCQ